MNGVWREPGEETVGLYPGLVVHDGRVSGSITVGCSRLPVWALPLQVHGEDYDVEEYGYTTDEIATFIHHLLDLRGEFARLLLLLANAQRCGSGKPWWLRKVHRQRISRQMRRCLALLEPSA